MYLDISGLVGESELFPRPQRLEETFWRVTLQKGNGDVDRVDDDVNSWLYQQYRGQILTYMKPLVPTRGPDASNDPNGYPTLGLLVRNRFHHMTFDRGKSCSS